MQNNQNANIIDISDKNQYFKQTFFASNYSSIQEIVKAIPHLISLTEDKVSNIQRCRGLVIRSGNDDNIHKAIKYGVWTTTYKNKHKLEQYWKQYSQRNVETFLFFSAVKSGHFQGVARLASGYNEETFPWWWQNQYDKFKGHFELEWIYVKDITYRYFNGLVNVDNQDVTKSKDCDQLSEQTTKKMLAIYKKYNKNKSIFNDFEMFDNRQKVQLRGIFTPEQKMWLINQQYKQLQMQQYLLANYQAQQNLLINPNINQLNPNNMQQTPIMGQPSKQTKTNIVGNNPGFQMNPVSKPKKNYKQK